MKKGLMYVSIAVAVLVIASIVIFSGSTTGNAIFDKVTKTESKITLYDQYAINEIQQYIEKDNIIEKMNGESYTIIRESTDGKLIPSRSIEVFPGVHDPLVNPDDPIFGKKPKHCTYVQMNHENGDALLFHKHWLWGWRLKEIVN